MPIKLRRPTVHRPNNRPSNRISPAIRPETEHQPNVQPRLHIVPYGLASHVICCHDHTEYRLDSFEAGCY
jgi:hypothetical protein